MVDQDGETETGLGVLFEQHFAGLHSLGHLDEPVQGVVELQELIVISKLRDELLDLAGDGFEVVGLLGQEFLPLLLDGVGELSRGTVPLTRRNPRGRA